eukprot:gnl/Hemi2/27791_TR9184_c0_g2_i1.p1 gnl/Hemi2/27791_TR9184_c0_g2~~gnl/Hemi2/27791_TR9184_c0_g2_i1.p1  ORF type:complete len:353 (+),score=44.12 gnl/Hemi2/27791_TR9184_c0_g2_i1:718-1776(+)
MLALQQQGLPLDEPHVPAHSALPAPAHLALVELVRAGRVKHIITTNYDGIHRRCGIPNDSISELHGNVNLAFCDKCATAVLSDFDTTANGPSAARFCPACRSTLVPSVVPAGRELRPAVMQTARQQAAQCDLLLVLGSSLTAPPATNIPALAAANENKAKIVVCDLQPDDAYLADYFSGPVHLTLRADVDCAMLLLAEALGQPRPTLSAFRLARAVTVTHVAVPRQVPQPRPTRPTGPTATADAGRASSLRIEGSDISGIPFQFIHKVRLRFPPSPAETWLEEGKFVHTFDGLCQASTVDIELHFYRNYSENPLSISFPLQASCWYGPSTRLNTTGNRNGGKQPYWGPPRLP